MKLGIGSCTYPWAVGLPEYPPAQALTPTDLMKRALELDIRVVQFGDNMPLNGLEPGDLREITEFAYGNHIEIEVGTRGLEYEPLMLQVEIARHLDAKLLRVVPELEGQELKPDEVLARLRPVVRRLREMEMRLAIENYDRYPARILAHIVEELGPEHAGVCLDTANSFGALEGPEVVVETLAPYTINLHLKDFVIRRVKTQMGFVLSGAAVGQGRLNVPWILGKVRHAGHDDANAIIELWTPLAGTLEATIATEQTWAEQSIAYLREFITD
jgi:sugar phosphate isomerase/epimerase